MGKNIVTSHSLFEDLASVVRDGYLSDYHLIIDEVPNVVDQINGPNKLSIEHFYIQTGFMQFGANNKVFPTDLWRNNLIKVSDTLSDKLFKQAATGCLYLLDDNMFIWAMPKNLLTFGMSTTIYTFMSKGSMLCKYLDKEGIAYIVESSLVTNQLFVKKARELITLTNVTPAMAKMNFSYNKQIKAIASKTVSKQVQQGLKNLRSREFKGIPIRNVLITTIKDAWVLESKKAKETGGFSKGSRLQEANWISNTTRGTNDYIHCSHAIYLYDQNPNPSVMRWLGCANDKEFADQYALTELIQWLYRTRIRKGEPVELYLPSPRMRRVLLDWLDSYDQPVAA
jgi:hypothetical protein